MMIRTYDSESSRQDLDIPSESACESHDGQDRALMVEGVYYYALLQEAVDVVSDAVAMLRVGNDSQKLAAMQAIQYTRVCDSLLRRCQLIIPAPWPGSGQVAEAP